MEVLDTTIANVSLRYIAGGLSASNVDSEWVLTSYLAANATILPISGWISAHLGRRNYFLLSIAVFTIASGLCGMATSLGQLILFRVIQGVAGGGLQPSSQAILLDNFPPEKQGAAQTMFGIAALLAPVVGPTLGGYLTVQLRLALDLLHQPPGGCHRLSGVLLPAALSQKSSTSLGVLDAAWLFQMRRLSPHAVVGYGHRVMRRRALDGVAMAACIARRLDHRLGRDARRPPASAVRATLHRAALRPRSPHRHQLAARLRHGARLQTLLLPARQRGTQDPSDRQSLAPHPPQATPRRWCGYAVGLRHRRLPHQAVRAAR